MKVTFDFDFFNFSFWNFSFVPLTILFNNGERLSDNFSKFFKKSRICIVEKRLKKKTSLCKNEKTLICDLQEKRPKLSYFISLYIKISILGLFFLAHPVYPLA